MPISSAIAVDIPRARVWLPPSHTRPGAAAPVAARRQAAIDAATRITRRPRRSAAATITKASSTPIRTAARVKPWSLSLASNSSAAKVMVWVRSVPR